MSPRTRVLSVLALLGTAVSGGVGVALAREQQPVNLPTPAISLSTITLKDRDSVGILIAWTRRCVVGLADSLGCPNRFRLAFESPQFDTGKVSNFLRDTIRLDKLICPAKGTARASIIADRFRLEGTASSKVGVSAPLAIPCRNKTVAEVAFLDSFPDGNRKIVPATRWMYKSETDSLPIVVNADGSIVVTQGYDVTLCHLRKNRYTGKVNAHDNDPHGVCEAVRREYEQNPGG